MLKWFVEESGQYINLKFDNAYAFRQACSCGHLEVAKWMIEEYPSAVSLAALKYNFKIDNPLIDICTWSSKAFRNAASNNHLDIVKWLVKEAIPAQQKLTEIYGSIPRRFSPDDKEAPEYKVNVTVRNNAALRTAAENGYEEVVRWIIFDSEQTTDRAAIERLVQTLEVTNQYPEIIRLLRAVEKCLQDGIAYQSLCDFPERIKFVENGLSPEIVYSLASEDISVLEKSTKKSDTKIKI